MPTNVRLSPTGTVVIDWEFSGFYLPGYDLALLWVLLSATAGIRERIERFAGGDRRRQAGFWVNLASVLTRELRIHRELPDSAERADRLAVLDSDWVTVRARIHQIAAQIPGP